LDSLIGCAVLAMFKRYRKRASLPINLNYRVLSGNFASGTNPNFLVPTGASPARTLQLGFRVTF